MINKPRKLGKIGKHIDIFEDYQKFHFDDCKYGYILDDYLPKSALNSIRFRDLVIFFHQLHTQFHGFKGLRIMRKRNKHFMILASSAMALIFLTTAYLTSNLLLAYNYLHYTAFSIQISIICCTFILFFVLILIFINHIKMDVFDAKLKMSHQVKRYLESENYYWMIKRFFIFDVDINQNIYVVFQENNDIMEQYGLKKESIRLMAEDFIPDLVQTG